MVLSCLRAGVVAALLAACSPLVLEERESRPALGTVVEIVARGPDRPRLRAAIEAAFHEVERLEAVISERSPSSEIARINRLAGGTFAPVRPETESLLWLVREVAASTGGAFDPTALPLLRLYGLPGEPRRIPGRAAVEEALARVGWGGIEIRPGFARLSRPGMAIALGGIADGFIADRAVLALRAYGAVGGYVDAGGRIAVWDPDGPGFAVQLEAPDRPGEVIGELPVRRGGAATASAIPWEEDGASRAVLDPRTGWPAPELIAATVVAPTAARAAAWAAACLVQGEAAREALEGRPELGAILVTPGRDPWVSTDLRERVDWKGQD